MYELVVRKVGAVEAKSGSYTRIRGKIQSALPARGVLYMGAFLATLQALDGILTSIGMQRFGLHMEGNPLLRSLMEQFGYIETLAVTKFAAIIIVVALTLMTKELPWIKGVLGFISGVYVVAAILPWTYILFINPLPA